MLRPVLSIAMGFVVWTVVWLASNFLAMAMLPDALTDDGSPATAGLLITFLAVSVLCSLAAGFVAAKVLNDGCCRPILVLACLVLAVGIFVEVQYWEAMPVWYHLVFLVLLLPMTLAGGRLGGSTRWS